MLQRDRFIQLTNHKRKINQIEPLRLSQTTTLGGLHYQPHMLQCSTLSFGINNATMHCCSKAYLSSFPRTVSDANY